jgi:Sec-independent protein secretion pathway component TatC
MNRMIQRGYIILIIGGVLFVAGIIIAAVWAIPFASTFLQNNTLINQVSIEPGRSVEATTQVTDISRPIAVAIHVERPGERGTAEEDG